MILIVDASVVVKWFVPEANSEAAAALLDSGDELVAPDTLRVEVASALLKALRRDAIDSAAALEALSLLTEGVIRIIPVAERVAKALVLVREHGGSLYDGLYLSLARELDAPVVTSDARMADVALAAAVRTRMIGAAPAVS